MTDARPGPAPALFVGHGSPMNAIEESEFSRGFVEAARRIGKPKAVLCVSAHWETRGVRVTAAERPATIHDFSGLPRALFEVLYPAPGDPALARDVAARVTGAGIGLDDGRGLDHGAWSVLRRMYPDADVPVVQLSLDRTRSPAAHLALARELSFLRDEGVLFLGSGDVVHNLRVVDFAREDGYEWAVRFDEEVRRRIGSGDLAALVDYARLPGASLAVPTPEHYLPLLYVLASKRDGDAVSFFNGKVVFGSISMTSVEVGAAA